jgi:RHS repeat-associated protein
MKLRHIAGFWLVVAGCWILSGTHCLRAQVYDPTLPDRGINPLVSYAYSEFEAINTSNGNLVYRFPITKLPPGRAGLTADFNLTYNSAIYDVKLQTESWPTPNGNVDRLTSRLQPSTTGGGWRYSYSYSVIDETIPGKSCATNPKTERLFVVFPDGSRHILHLYTNGVPDDNGDGGSPYYPNGQLVCPNTTYQPITTGNLTYFTTDGTFIRFSIPASSSPYWTNSLWTIMLPDGRTVGGYGSQTTVLHDRHWNAITWTNLDPINGNPQTLVRDDLQRAITLQHSAWQDTITQTGFNNQVATWTVSWDVSTVASSLQYQCTENLDLCTGSDPFAALSSLVVASVSVASPGNDTATYSFTYDEAPGLGWGELRKVSLPAATGETPAAVTYTYQQSGRTKLYSELLYNPVTQKDVDWQEQQDGGSTPRSDRWTYQYGSPVQVTGPDGGNTKYYFETAFGRQNLANRIEYPDGSIVQRTWYQNRPLLSTGVDPANPYVKTETRTVGSFVSTKTYTVDKNGNRTRLDESDWGGVNTRSTSMTYNVTTVDAGSGAEPISDSTYAYWNGLAGGYLTFLTRSVTSGTGSGAVHEYEYNANFDLTTERHWNSKFTQTQPLTAANAIVITRYYDSYGNPTLVLDGRGISTTYNYDLNSLYVAAGTAYGLSFLSNYDFNSGLLSSRVDENNVQQVFGYDALGRRTAVTDASGTSLARTTLTTYKDANRRIIVRDGGGQVSVTEYDQLRRVRLTRRLENPAQDPNDSTIGIKVQTRYLNDPVHFRSYRLESNPYRAATSGAASGEETMGWTLTTYDTMGRVIAVQHISGAALPAPWGSSSASTGAANTTYTGNTATTWDESQTASWTSSFDALGRVQSLTENGIAASTTYAYDALDNLTAVTQATQPSRSFTYDSLGRLTKAVNGETGTTCYDYDNDGNLTTRTQRANSNCSPSGSSVVTTYVYDPQYNRIQRKVMPEGTVYYNYGGGAYQNERLTSVTFGGFATNYLAHDALGRVTSHSQVTNGQTYTFGYTYNSADDFTSLTYPSGRVVNFGHDSAGRVNQVSTTGITYATGTAYAAHGALRSLQFGNGWYETRSYNPRLQVGQVSLGSCAQTGGPNSPACSSDQWWLQNTYSGTQNNGNILQQTIGLPGGVQIPEAYRYDGANRLLVVAERSSNPGAPYCPDSGSRYCQGFQYDVWGNRTVPSLTGMGPALLTPTSYNSSNNQISSSGSGWGYDSRGNISNNPAGQTFAYDSENRQVAFCTSDPAGCPNLAGTGRTLYSYDGDGRRVQKSGPTGTTIYVYDVMGNLAAEYSTVAPTTTGTMYLTGDHLGNTRVISNGSPGAASVVQRRDYLPFGEEYGKDFALVGGDPRASVVGYPPETAVTLKFTGKERDAESGLDYFGARYFSGGQGRFTSPDSPLIDQSPDDPQSWNLYSYVRNNPLIFSDPTGNDCVYVNSAGNGIDSINNQNTSKDCGKTGGYWVDGTVTNARFAYGSLILTGTTNGTNRTSASYGLGPDPGLMALQEAGNRASRDLSTSAIIMGGTAAAMAATFVAPIAYAALPATSEAGVLVLGGKALQLALDAAGKVKGNIREVRAVVYRMSPEQLRQAADELRQSISIRAQEMLRLGQNTPSGPAHQARLEEERAILRMIEKKLGIN